MRIGNYKIKPRFFLFLGLGILIISIFFKKVTPNSYFTSNYWQGF